MIETPLDIPGCLGWLETDSDGTPLDQVKARRGGAGEWALFPLGEGRGHAILFDHDLTDAERQELNDWAAAQMDPVDQVQEAEAHEASDGSP